MKILLNDIKEFEINYAREVYIIDTQRNLLTINFEQSEETYQELISFFNTNKIYKITIFNNKNIAIFNSEEYTKIHGIYNFLGDNTVGPAITLELEKEL